MTEEKLLCYDLIESENVEDILRRENEEDCKNLAIRSQQIGDIAKSINELIGDSDKELEIVNTTVSEAADTVEDINVDLEHARENKMKGVLLKGTLIGTGIGFAVGGIAGGVIGSYLGSIGIGFLLGSIPVGGLSGGTAYGIIKNKST
jgi:hypothetical protein